MFGMVNDKASFLFQLSNMNQMPFIRLVPVTIIIIIFSECFKIYESQAMDLSGFS
jgi:hypothetical protein